MSWNPWKLRRLLAYEHDLIESLDGDLRAARAENLRLRDEVTKARADVRLDAALQEWLMSRGFRKEDE